MHAVLRRLTNQANEWNTRQIIKSLTGPEHEIMYLISHNTSSFGNLPRVKGYSPKPSFMQQSRMSLRFMTENRHSVPRFITSASPTQSLGAAELIVGRDTDSQRHALGSSATCDAYTAWQNKVSSHTRRVQTAAGTSNKSTQQQQNGEYAAQRNTESSA